MHELLGRKFNSSVKFCMGILYKIKINFSFVSFVVFSIFYCDTMKFDKYFAENLY